ncbi:MAG TPA: DUF502 domain-containing protein [Pelomicrobium sp.]|nr:DUF502 domain-containing protein [Pelomicrobium sp.]
MRKAIGRTFLTGLLTVVPVVATIYLVVWLATTAETFLGRALKWIIPDQLYFYGMGMAAGVGVLFVVGVLMQTWAVRKLFELGEYLLLRMPLVKTIYGAVRDFFGLFSGSAASQVGRVVTVELPGMDARLVGFLMREDLSQLPEEVAGDGRVAVYLPMSYQVGGYTVLVPRDAVKPVGMSREEAMRFVLTAGLSSKAEKPGPAA